MLGKSEPITSTRQDTWQDEWMNGEWRRNSFFIELMSHS